MKRFEWAISAFEALLPSKYKGTLVAEARLLPHFRSRMMRRRPRLITRLQCLKLSLYSYKFI